jgi:hypothetical protein
MMKLMKRENTMASPYEENKQLYKTIQDQDPRNFLSNLEIPEADRHMHEHLSSLTTQIRQEKYQH